MHVALLHDHVGGRAGGGGGVRQMLELAAALDRAGHRVTVVCHDHDPATTYAGLDPRIEIRAVRTGTVEIPRTRRAWLARQWAGMRRVAALVPDGADVVNAHEWPALHAGRWAARRTGAPLVWTRNDEVLIERAIAPGEVIRPLRGPLGRAAAALAGLPDWLAARAAAEIVVLDERNVRLVRRVHRREPAVARSGPAAQFYEPPDRARARARLGIADDAFLALAVGILLEHRRFEDLVDAAGLLDGLPGLSVRIIGSDHMAPAYAAELRARIDAGGLRERVALDTGGVDERRLRDLYAAADVFVFPDRMQSWGLVPLEALAGGTPVIVTERAGVTRVLRNRPGVTVVPPCDSSALARALAAHALGEVADVEPTRSWLRRELGNDRYAEAMLGAFEAAAGAARASEPAPVGSAAGATLP